MFRTGFLILLLLCHYLVQVWQSQSAEAVQRVQVRAHCLHKCFALQIRQVKLIGRLFHDVCDSRVMHMADAWEQVVLDLEVQATYVPRKKLALA